MSNPRFQGGKLEINQVRNLIVPNVVISIWVNALYEQINFFVIERVCIK